MSALDALAPDQRVVVALLLGQGRSYEDIAALLGIPVAAVRTRAHAGLSALAPANGLPGEVTAPLADYLLGQLSPSDAAATRGLLAESAPARTWTAEVARALEPEARGALPEVPGDEGVGEGGEDAAAVAAGAGGEAAVDGGEAAVDGGESAVDGGEPGLAGDDRPAAARGHEPFEEAAASAPPRSSKLGGAVLILGVVAAVVVALVVVLGGGDDDEADPPAATPAPSATAAPAQVTDQIALRAVGGSGASGRMTVYVQDGRLLFQLQAVNVPPSGRRTSYAVWFTGPGTRARRLGYTEPVGRDGVLGIQGPSDTDLDVFPRLYATYERVVVSRESATDARRPADPVLAGPLPRGRRG